MDETRFTQDDLYHQLELVNWKDQLVPVISNWVYVPATSPVTDDGYSFFLLGCTFAQGWHATSLGQRFVTHEAAARKMKTSEELVELIRHLTKGELPSEWKDLGLDLSALKLDDTTSPDDSIRMHPSSPEERGRFDADRFFYDSSCVKRPTKRYSFLVKTWYCAGFGYNCGAGVAWRFYRVASVDGKLVGCAPPTFRADDETSATLLSWHDFCARTPAAYRAFLEFQAKVEGG